MTKKSFWWRRWVLLKTIDNEDKFALYDARLHQAVVGGFLKIPCFFVIRTMMTDGMTKIDH